MLLSWGSLGSRGGGLAFRVYGFPELEGSFDSGFKGTFKGTIGFTGVSGLGVFRLYPNHKK